MLTSEQLEHFDQFGYLVVEDILHPQQVLQPILDEYDLLLRNLCAQWVSQGKLPSDRGTGSFQQLIRAAYLAGLDYFQPLDISLPPGDIASNTPFHAGPAIFNLITSERLLDVVESLIGAEITSNPIQHVRIKPPAIELDSEEIRPHITHTNPMLRHCPSPQLSIPDAEFAVDDAVALPVRAGGAVLFHPQTIHSSLVNVSDTVRWSFDLRYNVTGQPTGRPMFPDFIVRSRVNPDTVRVKANDWKLLWEQARANLAAEKPVVIHRWPEDPLYCA